MSLCSILLLVGNLLDGLCTLVLLQLDMAQEANPLLAWVYGLSPLSFMVAKLALVQFGMLLLWAHRHVRAAQVALQLTAGAYGAVVLYHVAFVVQLAA
ncbi:MAG TPA: DUF5658 family protein [Vicinamibacteria bacterium]|nr:DUF5658 family protein [Vicinamibacteria bacterium]